MQVSAHPRDPEKESEMLLVLLLELGEGTMGGVTGSVHSMSFFHWLRIYAVSIS